jgi:hypothetical protein
MNKITGIFVAALLACLLGCQKREEPSTPPSSSSSSSEKKPAPQATTTTSEQTRPVTPNTPQIDASQLKLPLPSDIAHLNLDELLPNAEPTKPDVAAKLAEIRSQWEDNPASKVDPVDVPARLAAIQRVWEGSSSLTARDKKAFEGAAQTLKGRWDTINRTRDYRWYVQPFRNRFKLTHPEEEKIADLFDQLEGDLKKWADSTRVASDVGNRVATGIKTIQEQWSYALQPPARGWAKWNAAKMLPDNKEIAGKFEQIQMDISSFLEKKKAFETASSARTEIEAVLGNINRTVQTWNQLVDGGVKAGKLTKEHRAGLRKTQRELEANALRSFGQGAFNEAAKSINARYKDALPEINQRMKQIFRDQSVGIVAKVGISRGRSGAESLLIENQNEFDWTGVRVTLNGKYVCKGTSDDPLQLDPVSEDFGGDYMELDRFRDAQGRSFGPVNFRGIQTIKIETNEGTWTGTLSQ